MSLSVKSLKLPRPKTKSLLEATTASSILRSETLGDVDPLTPEQLFIKAVTRWIQEWADNADEDQCKGMRPSAFVFAEDGEPEKLGSAMEEALSFRNAHDHEISGTLHGCTLEMKQVFRQKVDFQDSSAVLTWLKAHCPKNTAIVFLPKTRDALIRRAGTNFNDCERIPFGPPAGGAFDFSQVDGLLDTFHENWTRTPQSYCRVWDVPKTRKLNHNPENQIQGSLKAYFDYTVRPKGALVDEEFATRLGRGDVRLVRWSKNKIIEICIMELKVLFNDQSLNWNTKWALSGINQITDYRDAVGYPGPSFLCCFDSRSSDTDIPKVEAEAKLKNIKSKRFFMRTKSRA